MKSRIAGVERDYLGGNRKREKGENRWLQEQERAEFLEKQLVEKVSSVFFFFLSLFSLVPYLRSIHPPFIHSHNASN
jgi:hypothetical protein